MTSLEPKAKIQSKNVKLKKHNDNFKLFVRTSVRSACASKLESKYFLVAFLTYNAGYEPMSSDWQGTARDQPNLNSYQLILKCCYGINQSNHV